MDVIERYIYFNVGRLILLFKHLSSTRPCSYYKMTIVDEIKGNYLQFKDKETRKNSNSTMNNFIIFLRN